MSDDLPELRIEIDQAGYHLALGGKRIATYTMREAVEQVIENWLTRRAAGETDEQITPLKDTVRPGRFRGRKNGLRRRPSNRRRGSPRSKNFSESAIRP
jgi:hypothetical protein